MVKMIPFISKYLEQKKCTADQEFLEGFHGILESQKQRRKMAPAQLAIRLSECEKDSPAYILLSHELNCRIARIQSKSNYWGFAIGVAGIFLGWALAQWRPFESKTSFDIIASHIDKNHEEKVDSLFNKTTCGVTQDQTNEKTIHTTRKSLLPKDK